VPHIQGSPGQIVKFFSAENFPAHCQMAYNSHACYNSFSVFAEYHFRLATIKWELRFLVKGFPGEKANYYFIRKLLKTSNIRSFSDRKFELAKDFLERFRPTLPQFVVIQVESKKFTAEGVPAKNQSRNSFWTGLLV
jgi:hypothetical protein